MSAADELRTAEELLAHWDAGRSIWSIEVGGIGPGYEQAIQVLAVETVREALAAGAPRSVDELTEAKQLEYTDRAVARLRHYGFSGAQVGQSRWLARKWLLGGPAALQAEAKSRGEGDRCILVDRTWLRAPDPDQYPEPEHPLFFDAGKLAHVCERFVELGPAERRVDRIQDVAAAKRVLSSPAAHKLQLQRAVPPEGAPR